MSTKQNKITCNIPGWDNYAQKTSPSGEDFVVGRVSVENKDNYILLTESGETEAILRGKFLSGFEKLASPKVGDWVKIKFLPNEDKAVIEEILPRFSKIFRKSPDGTSEQVMLANIDTVFIVQGLPDDFNLSRLERYLIIAKQGGATPVIVLNKIDLVQNYLELSEQARQVSTGAPVIGVSAKSNQGLVEILSFLKPGKTFCFLGSSGVGKSTLVNSLIGKNTQTTQAIRNSDGRGRHTTTKREMFVLENGSILVDTPGMRELGIWEDPEELIKSFQDIEELALQCKFSNCDHQKSQGCAVKLAVESGDLPETRYRGFLKMKKELEFLESKGNKQKQADRKNKSKQIHKTLKKRLQEKY